MSEIPYPCKVNGQEAVLVRNPNMRAEFLKDRPNFDYQKVGLLALALFWRKSEMDYMAVGFINEQGEECWQRMFEAYDQLDWMAGFVLPTQANAQRAHDLQSVHRHNETFLQTYGWAPDVVIELHPTDQEEEAYAQSIIGDDLDDDAHLYRALRDSYRTEFE